MIVFLAALAAATGFAVFMTERVDRPRRRAADAARPAPDRA